MSSAMRIHQPGGPEAMQWDEVPVGETGANEVRIRHTAVGVNFIDTYHRSGLYPLPLPATIGREAAGVVEEVGSGVTDFAAGDRVTYCTGALGAYCEVRNVPADKLIKLPEGITDVQAASMMLKGLTVQYLFRRTYPLKSGDTILFHAAAGGVGLIAAQWAKALGVTMIGTVGSDEKAELAKAHGCTHTIVYTRENFTEKTREFTGGKGVPVVYDGVGKDTFMGSLDSLSKFGMLVSYGNASGPVTGVNLGILAAKGSLYITRPTLDTYTQSREELLAMAGDLFNLVQAGKIRIEPSKTFALKDAAEAHRELESRRTTGSIILVPYVSHAMIVFDLECESGHGFEGWFGSTDAYERQREGGLLECPLCGTKTVRRRLSAPRLNLGASAPASESARQSVSMTPSGNESEDRAKMVAAQTKFYQQLSTELSSQLRQILERSDNVGDRFAEEARRIHYKETPERQIHGSATREETIELIEEGIPVLPMPFGVKNKDELN